jgi:hypothetical protein
MQTPCYVTRDTDRHFSKQESEEQRREKAKADLVAEFMACASLPALTSVQTPTDLDRSRRTSFLDAFGDGLTWSKNRHLLARVVAELMRSDLGQGVLRELAEQYADDYADEVAA